MNLIGTREFFEPLCANPTNMPINYSTDKKKYIAKKQELIVKMTQEIDALTRFLENRPDKNSEEYKAAEKQLAKRRDIIKDSEASIKSIQFQLDLKAQTETRMRGN